MDEGTEICRELLSGKTDEVAEEDALLCLVLLYRGMMQVHPDAGAWGVGEALTGSLLESSYRFPRKRFGYLLRRASEHAENVRTCLLSEGSGTSFAHDPEGMVAFLSADVNRAEFAPLVREALVCFVLHLEVLAEQVILSEDTWALGRLHAAKAAPRYGIPRDRFRFLLDGALATAARLRDANPFSAIY